MEASETTASRLLFGIQADLHRLTEFPLSGALRANLASSLRMKTHGAYGIYYMASDHELIVVRVLHAARDATAIADAGGLER